MSERNENNDTPLHLTIKNGKFETEQIKEKYINIKNKDGYTPLHLACMHKYRKDKTTETITDYVLKILKKKPDISITDKEGNTMLHHLFYNIDLTTLIDNITSDNDVFTTRGIWGIFRKIDKNHYNIQNNSGNTFLHIFMEYAIKHPSPLRIISDFITLPDLLTKFNLELSLKNKNGDTPLHVFLKSYKKNLPSVMTKVSGEIKKIYEHGESYFNRYKLSLEIMIKNYLEADTSLLYIKDNNNLTPYNLALELDNDVVNRLLNRIIFI